MALPVWGNLQKSQIDSETIEEAIARLIQGHEDDSDAHIEVGESLQSHKASAIIDHVVSSIIADKIGAGEVTAPKIIVGAKTADCMVAVTGGDYTNIQAAIDAGKKTIFVSAGTYVLDADIVLDGGITLIGENKINTILDFDSSALQMILNGEGNKLSGFQFKNSTDANGALYIETSNFNNISDVLFGAGITQIGIKVKDDSHYNLILNNIFVTKGIVDAGPYTRISNNTFNFSGAGTGIIGGGSYEGLYSYNTFNDMEIGISATYAKIIIGNSISDITVKGIDVGGGDCIVKDNYIIGFAGADFGIYVNTNGNVISGNFIQGVGDCIYVDGGNNNSITANRATSSLNKSINIDSGTENIVTGNQATSGITDNGTDTILDNNVVT